MNRKKLSEAELQDALTGLPEWKLSEGKLVREWIFPDFVGSMAFVNKVAQLAELEDHHPDIDIRYNHVKLGFMTHDAGGITATDTKMCALLDRDL